MPLVVITGRPCTGKTCYASQLAEYLREKGNSVVLVNEESLNLSKAEGYRSSAKEKDVRGALKSAVDHALTTETFVIIDSLNYIKGYRYELYCISRAMRTPHCVVWVASSEQFSRAKNAILHGNGQDTYDPSIIEDLRIRFEAPNENNRWDNPLFKVKTNESGDIAQESVLSASGRDDSSLAEKKVKKSSWKPKKKVEVSSECQSQAKLSNEGNDSVPNTVEDAKGLSFSGSVVASSDNLSEFEDFESSFERILNHLSNSNVPLPNCATIVTKHAEADLLYELDRISQRIVQTIMTHQTETLEGTPIKFPEYDRGMSFHRQISLAELQRYRGQFVKINAQSPPTSQTAIGASFIDFLAVHL